MRPLFSRYEFVKVRLSDSIASLAAKRDCVQLSLTNPTPHGIDVDAQ
jgi:hypothetical protein